MRKPRGRDEMDEGEPSHDRWLVSYADFLTLLFAFFVVMYAISTLNEGKYRVLSDSLMSAFRHERMASAPQRIGPIANLPAPSRSAVRLVDTIRVRRENELRGLAGK